MLRLCAEATALLLSAEALAKDKFQSVPLCHLTNEIASVHWVCAVCALGVCCVGVHWVCCVWVCIGCVHWVCAVCLHYLVHVGDTQFLISLSASGAYWQTHSQFHFHLQDVSGKLCSYPFSAAGEPPEVRWFN